MYQLKNQAEVLSQQSLPFIMLPKKVQTFINDILFRLDERYGTNRDPIHDLGGYVIVVETPYDYLSINKMTGIDLNTAICELVDLIKGYYCCLILLGSDYGLYFIIPESIVPVNIRHQMNL